MIKKLILQNAYYLFMRFLHNWKYCLLKPHIFYNEIPCCLILTQFFYDRLKWFSLWRIQIFMTSFATAFLRVYYYTCTQVYVNTICIICLQNFKACHKYLARYIYGYYTTHICIQVCMYMAGYMYIWIRATLAAEAPQFFYDIEFH